MDINKVSLAMYYLTFFLLVATKSYGKVQHSVGGIFHNDVDIRAFQLAIYELNSYHMFSSFELVDEVYNSSYYDTFDTGEGVCRHLRKGVIGMFGPSSTYSSLYIQSICDHKEIPQVETHWDTKMDRSQFVVNLHPHPSHLGEFFVRLVYSSGWDRFVILYEDDESLLRIAPLFDLNVSYGTNVILRQLELDDEQSYRTVFLKLKRLKEYNVLIDCSVDTLNKVLKNAQEIGVLNEKYNYIITNFDFITLDVGTFQYGGANITGVRLFDPLQPKVQNFTSKIKDLLNQNEETWIMKTSTALLIDGINLFYDTLLDFDINDIDMIRAQPTDCFSSDSWKFGYTIVNNIKAKYFQGITGNIQFDQKGFRKFKLELVELTPVGIAKVGEWNSVTKELSIDARYSSSYREKPDNEKNLFNRTFTIITSLTAPYAMLKETKEQLTGNDRYEGFCIDVIQELADILHFNYTFVIQEDKNNGEYHAHNDSWDGVIGKVVTGKVDLAITDLTITSKREKAVDFTMPFMNLGISILYKKAEPEPPNLFMFTSPFTTTVWLMLGVAFLFVSLAIFIMGRISPSEWTNPYPCIEEPDYLVNQFSIRNSLWFTIGALMQQGSELAPISISTRTASGFWWFFVLIMVASYTANLAAFLTVETLVFPFKNIEELADQDKIKYGTKKGGSTESFFKEASSGVYKKIGEYIEDHQEYSFDSERGIEEVEKGNYAYLMESTSIEYVIARHCKLDQIGGLLDDKGYGIAMKRHSPYLNELSTTILRLQESGRLASLKIKWWKEKRGGSACGVKSTSSEATALDLKNVGGVFLVLFVGAGLGFLGSFIELCYNLHEKAKANGQDFKNYLKSELDFFLQFSQNTKEVTE